MGAPVAKIWVTFDKVGFHRYPNAPDEVAYLRLMHRHLFKFKVTVDVFHDDRELEFHMFKTWCLKLFDDNVLQLDHKSCEMIASELANKVVSTYPGREVTVDVSEDGECGAIITRGVA